MKGSLKNIPTDWALLGVLLSLICLGLLCLYSATVKSDVSIFKTEFGRQIIWACIGFIIIGVILFVPLNIFFQGAYVFYGLSILFLVVVLLIDTHRTHRWIELGFIRFQPSEIAKVATLIVLARLFSQGKSIRIGWKLILGGMVLSILPAILILREPDIGTASVFIALMCGMILWAGIRPKVLVIAGIPIVAFLSGFHIAALIGFLIAYCVGMMIVRPKWWAGLGLGAVCGGLGLLTPVIWSSMEIYQKHRIATFLGLHSDPHGAAYQVIQSKVAIGSGAIIGKGFLGGSQTQLRFLPEQQTDFIFSVLGEEFGFIGVVIAFGLFLFLFNRIFHIAKSARNPFASFIAFGCVTVLAFQFLINVGMTVGLVPVTGLPLPFLSYGGSSLLMTMTLIGLSVNISGQRYVY
jgi:rod shape determining protein RodA